MTSYAEDCAQIRRLLALYCRGIDRLDCTLLTKVYWEDGTDHHGNFMGPAPDFIDYIIPRLKQRYIRTHHMLGHSLLNVVDGVANCETYFYAQHLLRDPNGQNHVTVGRYMDRLSKRNGEWRISEREVIMDWYVTHPVGPTVLEWPYFGTANKEDPSYRMLGSLG